MKTVIIVLLSLIAGIAIGYYLHPEPTMWDIFDDPRGCVIRWDDGEVQVKSRQRNLGTLKPGESKTIEVGWSPTEGAVDIGTISTSFVCPKCGGTELLFKPNPVTLKREVGAVVEVTGEWFCATCGHPVE